MRIAVILPCLALAMIATGCGDGGRPASAAIAPAATAPVVTAPAAALSIEPYSEGGAMKPFYGEAFHDGRYYLFGTRVEFTRFLESHSSNPLISKNYIAKGPNRETVVCEKPKDSPSMAGRLVDQFRKRHGMPPIE